MNKNFEIEIGRGGVFEPMSSFLPTAREDRERLERLKKELIAKNPLERGIIYTKIKLEGKSFPDNKSKIDFVVGVANEFVKTQQDIQVAKREGIVNDIKIDRLVKEANFVSSNRADVEKYLDTVVVSSDERKKVLNALGFDLPVKTNTSASTTSVDTDNLTDIKAVRVKIKDILKSRRFKNKIESEKFIITTIKSTKLTDKEKQLLIDELTGSNKPEAILPVKEIKDAPEKEENINESAQANPDEEKKGLFGMSLGMTIGAGIGVLALGTGVFFLIKKLRK